MKKFLIKILVLLMLVTLTACGSGNTTHKETDVTAAKTETSVEETDEAAAKAEPDFEETTVTEADVAPPVSFDELVVIDNEACSIKITAIDPDNMWGYTLKTLLENKTDDLSLMFSVERASVNGIDSDPFFASEVSAGMKANKEINFMDSYLKDNGIDFSNIELSFRVYDSDDWFADDIAKETAYVYPLGEENASTFVRESQPDDNIIVDDESARVTVTGYGYDDIWGYTVYLYLENMTDEPAMFSVDDVAVNGFMLDPFYAKEVGANKVTFSSISWSETAFEENGIEDVESINMNFRVYNSDDWLADDYVNVDVTLQP
ncbi:MAG: hypothetical protein PHV73_06710 [Eubacteriales bacterium]|nr:hypothetical protein [Eubacteriales bacterium]